MHVSELHLPILKSYIFEETKHKWIHFMNECLHVGLKHNM